MARTSIIIASRNDNWEGNPAERLTRTLSATIAHLDAADEIVLIDFGSVEPLATVLPDTIISDPRLRIKEVAASQASAAGGDFNECAALPELR